MTVSKLAVASVLALLAVPALAGKQGSQRPRKPAKAETSATAPAPARAAVPDRKAVAERIAADVLAVEPGELVLVGGDLRAIELVEDLAVAIARRGGSPLQLVSREQTELRFWTEVPPEQDLARMEWTRRIATTADAYVQVESTEHPGLLSAVAAERLAAAARADQHVMETLRARKTPLISIGNGLYPTEARARQLGLARPELERLFWAAMAVPAAELAREGDAVRRALAGGKQVRVTHPNGTDLRFSVEGRRTFLSTGLITADTREQGEVTTWLPAGEAYVAPVRGTAEGKLVLGKQPYAGGFIEGLTLTVAGGKVISHAARPSAAYERFHQVWDAAPEGKEELAVLDVGLNRGAAPPKGKTLGSYIPAGNVSLGVGGNVWAGGDVNVPFLFLPSLAGATVTVDGKVIVEKGALRTSAASM